MFNWIAQPFAVFNFGVSKIAVACVILRILPPDEKRLRWILFTLIAFTGICAILGAIFVFVHCNPPSLLWMGDPKNPSLSCWNPTSYYDWTLFQAGALPTKALV